jgi:hypothetical protein
MKQIRVILMGGLGNQFFQYAFALRISKKFNAKIILDPNLAAIRLNENGVPDLSSYTLHESISIADVTPYPKPIIRLVGLGIRLSLQKNLRFGRPLMLVIKLFLQVLMRVYLRERSKIFFAPDNGYFDLEETHTHTIYLGYFQSHEFSNTELEKTELLKIKPKYSSINLENLKQRSMSDRPLVVHIRLTDYRNEPQFGIPSKKYYRNSITHQMGRGVFTKIWLFSDEPETALRYIPDEFQSQVVNISAEISGTVVTLEAMRLGKGFVLANSSFSWWGASLANEKNALIIYPDPWFSGMPTPRLLCPPTWVPFDR